MTGDTDPVPPADVACPSCGWPVGPQDNFCEARSFGVGQCPTGFGHQGQDMRPAPCPIHDEGTEHCDPKQQAVVAVRDAVLIREPKQQAATLQVNTPLRKTFTK